METELYRAGKKQIAPEKADEYQTYILAVEERQFNSNGYPTTTYYKLVQVGECYKFYTYVIDVNAGRWAEREDDIPVGYSKDQVLTLWENLTAYMRKGAEIGTLPVFWEVSLNKDGTINSSIKEDWNADSGFLE